MAAKKKNNAGPLAPLGPSATTAPATTTTTRPPAPTQSQITKQQADWVMNRSDAYMVVLGLSRAAADKKAREEVETKDIFADDPFNILPPGNPEAPGAAKKQLAAFAKAKLDPRTNRWSVPGYGLYTEQDYSNTLSALKTNAGKPEGTGDNTNTNTNNTDAGRKPRDYGNKKPVKAIEGDTYTNSKNVKFTFKGGKYVRTATLTEKVDDTTSDAWKTIVQEEFGSLWDVYNMNPDVKKVLDDAVKGGYQDDEVKMEAKLQSTSWYRTTQQSARQWAVQQSTDPATAESRVVSSIEELRVNATNLGFTFNDETLRKLATDSIKFGWSDQQKLNALGSEQVASAQLGGAQGMADLRQSSVGRNLRAKAAAYYQKPSEEMIGSWTQQILTGQKSEVQFEETMRGSARTQFRSLQPALDKGEDVATAMYAYTQQAKSILGKSVDTSQIDWTQDKWNKALNFQDAKTGEYRQMDLWEWNQYLRTLPEWQNTDEANSAYGDLAMSLARGFGKTA